MKRTVLPFLSFCMLLLMWSSCKKENNSCFKSTGKMTSERRTVPDNIRFVKLEKNIDLVIEQDSVNYLIVDAGENLQDFIKTKSEGELLTITNENKCNFLRSYKKDITVYLHLQELDSVECNGSGNLNIPNTFVTENIIFNMSRTTGDIDVNINASNMAYFKLHQGVSTVYAKGFARYCVGYNSGSGWFDFSSLTTVFNQVNSRSTGNCIIKSPDREMFVLLNSSGDLIYRGDTPKISIWEHNGSGKIIHEP